MTHAEARILHATAARVESLERVVEAQSHLITALLDRKAGRPTREEAQRLDDLRGRLNGTHH